MTKAILLDAETVLLAVDGEFKSARLEDLPKVLRRPTDIAVVPADITKVVAQGAEEAVERQVSSKLQEGTVYCFEKLEGPEYQVFSIPEELLHKIRSSDFVESVVPYGVAVRDSQLSTDVSLVDRISRVVGINADDEGRVNEDVVCIDRMGNRVVLTAIQGDEIRAVRTLFPGDDLAREVFVTLQGASMPDSRLLTPDQWIADRLREAGQDVAEVRLRAEAPSFALHGLETPSSTRFYLPAERAQMRRKVIARQERRSLAGTFAFFLVCLTVLGGMLTWQYLVDGDIASLSRELSVREPQLRKLYQDRYAGYIASKQFNLPQAWAELEFMMPPQLVVSEVLISPGRLQALLKRRNLEKGAVDPPLSLDELRAAIQRSASWRGSTISMEFESHALHYRLEKLGGAANP
jgi:hypothetical protein